MTALDMLLAMAVAALTSVLINVMWGRRRDVEPLGDEGVPRQPPEPVDAANPPSWRTYRPRGGRPPLSCTCHPHRPLQPGQEVLWWPQPDGSVKVFCQEGVADV